MSRYADVFESLEKQGVVIDPVRREAIEERLNSIMSYTPKVGVFGKTGAGKSSLCNAVFGQDVCEISDVAACTRAPHEAFLSMGSKGIKLLDVPGVGESVERDKEYSELYKNLLPELDIILWVLKGDDRAFSSDEIFYKKLVRPYIDKGRPFFIVLNQVDKIEPFREWDQVTKMPGGNQAQNIEKKRRSVASIFELPLGSVIAVSANERYGLVDLVDNVIHSLPKEKKAIVLEEVNEENRSDNAKQEARDGLWDTIIEALLAVLPDAARSVVQTIGKAKEFLTTFFGGLLSR